MRLSLTRDEQRLLLTLPQGRTLGRGAFRGVPFRLLGASAYSAVSRLTFDEALVDGLVSRGLLRVTQAAQAMADIPRVPFSVILTADGEKARAQLIDDHVNPDVGNDDAPQASAA